MDADINDLQAHRNLAANLVLANEALENDTSMVRLITL